MKTKHALLFGAACLVALVGLVAAGLVFTRPSGFQTLSGPVEIARFAQSRGFLGVDLDPEDPDGVGILTVFPGSGAAEAGLRAGDLIIAVAGEPVSSVPEIQEAVGDAKPGSVVRLQIRRDGRDTDVDVRLMDGAEMRASRERALAESAEP